MKTMTGDVGFAVRLNIPVALMMTKADLIQYGGVGGTRGSGGRGGALHAMTVRLKVAEHNEMQINGTIMKRNSII
jgi:hypothetical protein